MTHMRATITAAVAAAIVLSGCAKYTAGRTAVLETGALVADEALDLHITGICWTSTVGAIRREFMTSAEAWQTWVDLCAVDRPMPGIASTVP